MESRKQREKIWLWLTAIVAAISVIWICSKTVQAESGSQDGLEVNVETDKEEYAVGEAVQVFVRAVNRGTEDLSNITIDLNVPEGVKLAEGTSTKILIASLAQGEIHATQLEAKAVETVSVTDTAITAGSTAVKTGDAHAPTTIGVIMLVALVAGIVLFMNPKHRKKVARLSGILTFAAGVALFSGMVYASTVVFEINKTIKISGIEKTIHVVISYEIGGKGDDTETSTEDIEEEEGVRWKYEDGTLTIYGKGKMEDYYESFLASDSYLPPWAIEYGSEIKNVIIESGITGIGSYAFWNCRNLTSVKIPSNVTSIGEYAFMNCSSLTSIEIPDGVTDISYVFYNCSSLTSIEIPDGVTEIHGAFSGCSSLTSIEIPDGVTEIGETFAGCSSLTSIEIPDGVTDITYAFYGCSSLTSIEIPDGVTGMYGAFRDCSSLTSIEIPDGVTDMSETFAGCSSLTSIEIPDGVMYLYSTFWGCSSLTNIEIPNGISMGENTFRYCSSLTSIKIPDGVTYIGYGTFWGCSSLTSIEIPSSVSGINGDAFCDCSDSLVIYGASGSYAETFANENGYTFIAQ